MVVVVRQIVEVTWKGKLKEAFPDPNAYSAFMGNFSTATGYDSGRPPHTRPLAGLTD